MPLFGSAESTKKVLASAVRSFSEFSASSEKAAQSFPVPFLELPAATLQTTATYQAFVQWALDKEAPLSMNTITLYTRALFNAAGRSRQCDADAPFFRPPVVWLTRMLQNVARDRFSAAIERGGTAVRKVVAIYQAQMRKISRAQTRLCTAKAASDRLVLRLIFRAAGRAGEVAFLAWDSLEYHSALGAFAFGWAEVKTGFMKYSLLCVGAGDDGAGTARLGGGYDDIYKIFADAFAFGCMRLPWSEGSV
jgi:hypothetical protein